MARSTGKSLARSATAAAKKVISRKSKTTKAAAKSAEPASEKPAKKAAAKKGAPAKKTAAKKAAAKTTAAKKTAPTKKTATKSAAKKGAPAKKAATKSAAKKTAPAKQPAPAKKTATKSAAPTKRTATKKTATKSAAKKAPAKKTAAKKAPAKKAAAKKTAARKTAPARLAVREDESAWTKAELDEVLTELNDHAERLRLEVHDQEEELAGLMKDAGDGAGHDQADMGATSFERDHELTVVNNARDMLAQTERALSRIEDGSYGVCESCGNPIGKMRLMAFPRATLCMACKQREEKRAY